MTTKRGRNALPEGQETVYLGLSRRHRAMLDALCEHDGSQEGAYRLAKARRDFIGGLIEREHVKLEEAVLHGRILEAARMVAPVASLLFKLPVQDDHKEGAIKYLYELPEQEREALMLRINQTFGVAGNVEDE